MAATVLRRGESVVWLPPRADGERSFASEARLLVAMAAPGGELRLARMSLEALQSVRQVRLVFDPRDVTLIPAVVPQLSGSRLAQALPNIVEESLLQDPAGCAMTAGPASGEGRRVIAVVDREWLEFTVGAFERRGIRVRSAVPAQLAAPIAPGEWSACCVNAAVALRADVESGLGWLAGADAGARADALVALVDTALQEHPRPAAIAVHVEDDSWREAVEQAAARLSIPMRVDGLPVPDMARIDLLSARSGAGRRMLQSFDPRALRLPLALAVACLVVALIGLNLHWAAMARERQALRAALEATFRSTFPSAQVVVDPVLQMNRQVSALRAQGGQSGPDDFMPLLARLSQALGARGADAIASIEYRDGRIRVRFQPARVEGQAARSQLVEACERAGLQLRFDGDREPTATVTVRA